MNQDAAAGRGDPARDAGGGESRAPAFAPVDTLIAADDPRTVATLRDAVRVVLPATHLHLASAPRQARLMLSTIRPAFVVVDLNFADPSPREFVAAAQSRDPKTRVVVVAGHGDDDRLIPALQGGAAGFLLKRDPVPAIEAHLRDVQSGVLTLTAALARQLIRHIDRNGIATSFSSVELELLTWAASGDTLAEGALRMKLSLEVAARHVQSVYERLRLGDKVLALPG